MRKKLTNNGKKPQQCRTTVLLTETLNENLDAMASVTGKGKAEIVREAISEYMTKRPGWDPAKKPTLTWKY